MELQKASPPIIIYNHCQVKKNDQIIQIDFYYVFATKMAISLIL